MKIAEILSVESIELNFKAQTKEELLIKMVDLAVKSGKKCDPTETRNEIFNREQMMSTGVGNGVALPHAKVKSIDDCIGSFVILDEPMDYGSIDGQPVSIIFMVLGKENNVGNHIRLLSKISRLLNESAFRSNIESCRNSEQALILFTQFEGGD
jgi:mannitol/fructose-specific phosphotransferase system IIA component (Ntr-type)